MIELHARLWKAAQLALNSMYFPNMVRAACWSSGIEFTDHILQWCAARPEILDPLRLEQGKTMDDAILALMQADKATGELVDAYIVQAVAAYKDQYPETE